jgi:hypothetical protein
LEDTLGILDEITAQLPQLKQTQLHQIDSRTSTDTQRDK